MDQFHPRYFSLALSRELRCQAIVETDLKGSIDSWMTGQQSDEHGQTVAKNAYSTLLILIVSIRNVGIPTSVEGWSLEVTPLGGDKIEAAWTPLAQTMTMHSKTGET